MASPSIEVIRRVYSNDEGGGFIAVGPDSDGVGIVEVSTTGHSVEAFGAARLIMSHEMAAKLGEALIAASKDPVE